jgi:hypothetical protein
VHRRLALFFVQTIEQARRIEHAHECNQMIRRGRAATLEHATAYPSLGNESVPELPRCWEAKVGGNGCQGSLSRAQTGAHPGQVPRSASELRCT